MFENFTPEVRLAMAAGVLSGDNIGQGVGAGLQNALPIIAMQKQQAKVTQGENQTRNWLAKQYPDQDFTTMPTDMVKTYAIEAMKQKFAKPDLPALAQEYQFAQQQGFDGNFMDYQKSKATMGNTSELPPIAKEFEWAKSQGFKGTFQDYQSYKANIDDGKTSDRFKTELDTMKTYRGEDPVKTFQSTRDAYEKVRTSSQLGTAQGDIGLIFGFMKMLDPTSVVREGEFATAQNSGGIDETVYNIYNKALNGERLTPEQRQKFVEAAQAQYENTARNLEDVNKRYKGLADAYNVPAERFLEVPKEYPPLQIGAEPTSVTLPDGTQGSIRRTK